MSAHAIPSSAIRWLAAAGAAGAFVTGLSVRATSHVATPSSAARVQEAVSDSVATVPASAHTLRVVALPPLKLPKPPPRRRLAPATPPQAPAPPPPTLVSAPAAPVVVAPRPASPPPSTPSPAARGPVFDSSG